MRLDTLVIAACTPHTYLRVGPKDNDEGRNFGSAEKPLFELVKTITGGKGKVIERRLLVVQCRKPLVTAQALYDAAQRLNYIRTLSLPSVRMPDNLIFCLANRKLRDIETLAKLINGYRAVVRARVSWPYIEVTPKSHHRPDAESAVCNLLGLPFGQHNTLWDYRA